MNGWPQPILGCRFLVARLAGELLHQPGHVVTGWPSYTMDVHPELTGLGVDRELDLGHG